MANNLILLVLPILLALTVHISTTEIFAQTGSMFKVGAEGDYAVSIVPGASQKDSTYHYYPPRIAVPTDTTVVWLNGDIGQPHTVTSGQSGAADEGSIFNSGVMPAFPVRFFEFTFTQAGDYPYHCVIHPWRVASVSVSDAQFTGEAFDIAVGSGATWDLTKNPRVLLEITPKTAVLDGFSPIAYNVTVNDGATNKTMISGIFTTGGDPLPLELVSGEGNETRSYGPDFSTAGAYHIQSDFKKGSSYPISVQVISFDNRLIDNPVRSTFNLQTNP